MTVPTERDHAPGLEVCLRPKVREDSYTVTEIEGQIPEFIRGTYYLNGPALFDHGDLRYRNWLDGDGMVCSLRFDEQAVHFRNRFVRGQKFNDEMTSGKPIYATFGTRFAGDRMRRGIVTESPYNVSVYRFRDAVLAFGEQSIPMRLHPKTLETLGEYDFDRQLNRLSPFSAHPKIDPERGELFNFGISFAGKQPCVNYYRIDQQGRLACRRRITIDHACSVHDFAVSQRFAAIYLSPYILDVVQLMKGGVATIDSLSWQPELGSVLLVMSRESGEEVARIPMGNKYCLHTIASFDQGDKLTVDLIELDRPVYDQYQVMPDLFTDVPKGRPARITVDLDQRMIVDRQQIDYRLAPDFPSVDSRSWTSQHDDFWMLGISAAGNPGRKFFDHLVHARWSTGRCDVFQTPASNYLGGEPAFLPNPNNQTDGAIICQEMNASNASSSFLIFNAFDIPSGPVARLRLNAPVHFGFHSSFYPD